MIGWVVDELVERVLAPQADPARGEYAAYVDPETKAIDTQPSEVGVVRATTRPTGRAEIGGTIELRHSVTLAVRVQHAVNSEAIRLRDGIVTDLVLRLLAAGLESETNPTDGQEVVAVTFEVLYLSPDPRDDGTPNEGAQITVDVDTLLPR